MHADAVQRGCTIEGRAVDMLQRSRQFDPLQLTAAFKGKCSNRFQFAVTLKRNSRQANIVAESISFHLSHIFRDLNADKVCAILERRQTNMPQPGRQCHLTQSALVRKGVISNRRNHAAIYHLRNGNESSVARIGTDFHGTIIQNNICIGNPVILIDPFGIEGDFISVEFICIVLVFFREGIIIIPAVEHGIQSFRFRQFLQGMSLNKQALQVVQFVGEHIIGDLAPFFQQQSAEIQRTKTIIPVTARIAQIITGGVENLCYIVECHVGIVLQQQRHSARHNRACKGSTRFDTVASAHSGGIGRTRCHNIRILAIIGVIGEAPAVQCAYADDMFIRGRPAQRRCALITGGSHADDIAVISKLDCRFKGIRNSICAKGHIDHIHVPLDGIVDAKQQVRGAVEVSVLVTFRLNNDDLHIRCDTHHIAAVHRCGNNAGNAGTVTLLIFDQRPVIVVLDNLIFRGIIGVFADTAGKFRVIGVDTGIDDSDRHAGTCVAVPNRSHIQIIQIGLQLVIRIRNGVLRPLRQSFPIALFLCRFTDGNPIDCRHLVNVLTAFRQSIYIPDGSTCRQSQRGKPAIFCNTQLCAVQLCQFLCFRFGGFVQNNALLVILTRIAFQFGQRLVL